MAAARGKRASCPIHLAGARRGRLSRAERIRERTLLDVLTTPVLSRVASADFETLPDRQSCGRAEHIADPQF